jgi:hypothetical protein
MIPRNLMLSFRALLTDRADPLALAAGVFERIQSDVSRDLTRRGETLDRPQGVNQGQAGESSDPRMGHQPSDVRVLFRQ